MEAPELSNSLTDPQRRSLRSALEPAEQVLADVVNGYVSIAAAERAYGVLVRYLGVEDQLVRLPEQYEIDWDATGRLRRNVE